MIEHSRATSFDEQLEALAHVYRRRLLYELAVTEEPIDLQESCQEILGADDAISLQHAHIPKLEDLEFVSCEGHELYRGPQFEEIEPLLELLDDHSEELPDDWL